MKKNLAYKIIAPLFLLLTSLPSLGWDHGVSIGYGSGEDMNHHNDTNSGGILSAEILSLTKNNWLNLTLDGSLADWYTTAPAHKDLFTAAVTLAFRTYVYHFSKVTPYLLISSGPAYLSHRHFGQNSQGANVAFQSSLGAGMEIGQAKKIDLNLKWIHYSNAYTMNPNQGFNMLYVVSIGYLF
ncbi:MAG: acyloxyacyl hydrolase [Gammaproteobacteria bacterium]|nr:acyloxyacyl hydrolase [Gammaproteobacteria bacterium]